MVSERFASGALEAGSDSRSLDDALTDRRQALWVGFERAKEGLPWPMT